jgi:hypothetical protein
VHFNRRKKMENRIKAALAATLITLGGLGVLACAPEAPEAPGGVEAPADPAGGGQDFEENNVNEK